MSAAETRRVVIVGGGVIGLASAHFLSREGWSVVVIDRGEVGRACSWGNCGLITPSDILPLAEPGAVGRTLRALLKRNSPFSIRPGLNLALWAWLLNFARRCNKRDMMAGAVGIHALLESSLGLYRDLVEQGDVDCEWEQRGLIFVYRDRANLDAYGATDRLLTESFHHAARRLEADELQAFEPALNPGLAGGWYYESDAQLRPDALMRSWRESLESRGVAFREHCEFQGFARAAAGGHTGAVATGQGEIAADAFVVAAGALTPLLEKHLGCRIPIQPGKGYSLTMPRPKVCPTYPLLFPETRVAVTPFRSGYRLGSTMEFAGYDARLNRARLQLLKEGARPYLREPYTEPIQEEWFGWRPMTYDSVPIIDRAPAFSNVLIAAGHNMLGVSMAPATGKLVAEMLGGGRSHIDIAPYRLARFAR